MAYFYQDDICHRPYMGGGHRPNVGRTLAWPAGLSGNEANLLDNLKGSVGRDGRNYSIDVVIVQRLLNYNLGPPFLPVRINECAGGSFETVESIKLFQRIAMGMKHPDGRVDPRGMTIRRLQEKLKKTIQPKHSKELCFPLGMQPKRSYKEGMRKFGSNRSKGKRKHAGCDLYADVNTEILAMADGTVIRDVYYFYLKTYALEIDHGDFIARYGEIQKEPGPGIKKGAFVKKGQVLGYVGQLVFDSGNKMSMLHLEMYSGTGSGPLTVKGNLPYKRRSDLIDPTSYLERAKIDESSDK